MGPLLIGAGNLVIGDANNVEVLNAFFALVFSHKFSQAPVLKDRVQGGEELSVVVKDQFRNLRERTPYKSMR